MTDIAQLAQAAALCASLSPQNRCIIAVVGVPGSGKSTLAAKVGAMLNSTAVKSVVVGMDGFHLPRSALAQMADPESALARRGAPFTFDGNAAVEFVRKLRATCSQPKQVRPTMVAPSFDHAKKDPVEDGTKIEPDTAVIFIEGLYLMLAEEPWSSILALVDLRWLVRVDEATALARVAARHLAAGIEPNLEMAEARAVANDMENAKHIMAHLVAAIDLEVWSA